MTGKKAVPPAAWRGAFCYREEGLSEAIRVTEALSAYGLSPALGRR